MKGLPPRAACIHGHYEKHDHVTEKQGWVPCPGGRDITIPDGEMTWMRVKGTNDDQRTYVLKPGGDPAGGDDQWEEVR